MLRMFWQAGITLSYLLEDFFMSQHLLMFERRKKATVLLFPGKKKQEHNPNAPPLNRQIPFPDM